MTEQVDRLSRLTSADWQPLKVEPTSRHVRVMALNLPTSWTMATTSADEFTSRMFEAVNILHADGVDTSVVHFHTRKPIDNDAVVEHAASL
ncbi:hypothetical protein JQ629_01075 [Bradyrhizobium sp. AUGA SZCCT0222]|uniref:hypothetical protein n=1 Tax=Bradyrhizobium sp. AUGA SZCCT0222 TaxID=2807668 RepID=UPI001BAA7D1E|nr:hypothetical protein [Bradyrhizobium sp. AUGA SZCCT0222]